MLQKFWQWYNRYYVINVSVAAGLFVLQLIHLYWLSADVIAMRLTGQSYFELSGIWLWIILIVDYLEIPAIVSVSLVYINELRGKHHASDAAAKKRSKAYPVAYLILLNSQWLHIFWITDEFVIEQFTGAGGGTILPIWLAWLAIFIDYLELPVIYDTLKKATAAIKDRKSLEEFKEVFAE